MLRSHRSRCGACGLRAVRRRSWLQLHVRRFPGQIECLGIEASPSFVRQPEGNGVAERFIRTLKENLLWVRTFDTIEESRAALVEFAGALRRNLARRPTWLSYPSPKCEKPTNVGLIWTQWTIYCRPLEVKLSRVSQNRAAVH